MTRRRSPVRITGPRLRLTRRGLRVQAPRARVGGRLGLHLSRSGVSGSIRSRAGTYNTRRGCTSRGCFASLLAALALVLVGAAVAALPAHCDLCWQQTGKGVHKTDSDGDMGACEIMP